MGPVISPQQQDRILSYCATARDDGAELVAGGRKIERDELLNGNFVEPTVFDQVRADMRLAQEEVFGPVLAVIPFGSED